MPGKLVYYNVNGRAECIRALLGHANYEYDDTRPDDVRQLPEVFASNKMGGWPIWIEDDYIMYQSNAILRMLAIRLGYYTTDPDVAYSIDSICDFIEDVVDIYFEYPLPKVAFHKPLGDADAWIAKFWDKLLPVLDGRLAAHGKKFIAGTDRPTMADFKASIFWGITFQDVKGEENLYSDEVLGKIRAKAEAFPHYLRWSEAMM